MFAEPKLGLASFINSYRHTPLLNNDLTTTINFFYANTLRYVTYVRYPMDHRQRASADPASGQYARTRRKSSATGLAVRFYPR
jgi:hypothetical protein